MPGYARLEPMTNMLPALQSSRLSLADVMASCLASVLRQPSNAFSLPPVDRAVVILVDGLGASALRSRAGHARFLAPRLSKNSTLFSGFPTTTVAGITSLTTGVSSGTHGLVAYRVLDAGNDRVVNQLSGWDAMMTPDDWQGNDTLFQRANAAGVGSYAIGPERYRDSGFSQAALRGAEYVSARSVQDRFEAARNLLDRGGRQLVYLYVPELDVIAHAKGSESNRWLAQLEQLDGELARFTETLGRAEGAVLTADHGVLDVPHTSHVLFGSDSSLTAGVRHVGGDPRCLHLYCESDASADQRSQLKNAWLDQENGRAWVATRTEAVDAGWFGHVAGHVLPRIGDVIIAARKRVAYYDVRSADRSSRSMIGQHGSFAAEETQVPLIRLGRFAW